MDKKSSPSPKEVKKENDEEIKDFAETAMNELLGWYGYERLEMRRWAASRAKDAASPEQTVEKPKAEECSWCNKCITSESGALQQAGATFCSELCFSQSRRANFKRAKTCDWCRHVRHTVAYVDFQDGATQLQFCSDKCLNQYKMHIFCRETQAHLDLNPHLVSASSSSNLITPELWLKNCKSRSATPNSERSSSPNPEKNSNDTTETSNHSRQSPLPLITVTPAAKLMNKSKEKPAQKSPEAKKEAKTHKINLRKRRVSRCSATVTSQTIRQSTPKAQDMRMRSPSIDGSSPVSSVTISNSTLHSPPNTINPPIPPQFPNPMFGMPPPFLEPHLNDHRPPMFPPRLPFMPHLPGMMQERPRINPPLNFQGPLGQPPPVTVLVPYPVILPVPLPIPIPIPMSAFLQAHCVSKVKTEKTDLNDDSEGPLDFTMNSEKNKETQSAVPNAEASKDDPKNEEAMKRISEERSTEAVENNLEQTLPKFKITRLGNKMAKIVTKTRDSESSRPLRKRRRLVEVASEDDPLIPKNRKIVQV
ncbi:sine oculis-binding protein homolog [Aricia agestis]|uniref:sine oculis-binding protein homolog n=1 Tax=Aricia agestis TaxID=91739 RepID=UPI001C20C42C|nr:sine oculis-binding protein homolog [Aricia agestis]